MKKKDRLKTLLESITDTYPDFVHGIILAVKNNDIFTDKLIEYINKNPQANSSEITDFLDELEGR